MNAKYIYYCTNGFLIILYYKALKNNQYNLITRSHYLFIYLIHFFLTVHGNIRIVRDCGYLEDPAHDDLECYSRLGSHEIDVNYCSCTSDRCNGSTNIVSKGSSYIITVVMMIATAAMGFFLNMHH